MIAISRSDFSTMPTIPAASTKPPSLKGRNSANITPEEKFDSESFKAKPIAKPAAANPARIEVVSILKRPSSAATPEFCWHPRLERLVRRYVCEIHIQGIAGGRARSS